MSGMNESFLSNIMPRNLYSLTTGISESSIFRRGSLCIFLREQKCTHLVLDLENQTVLFQITQFCISTLFRHQKTVLFRAIQFSTSTQFQCQNSSILNNSV